MHGYNAILMWRHDVCILGFFVVFFPNVWFSSLQVNPYM